MSSWVEVPLIKGARFVTIKDPAAKPQSTIEIAKSTADAAAAKITRRETGKFTIEFTVAIKDPQTIRYIIRDSASSA